MSPPPRTTANELTPGYAGTGPQLFQTTLPHVGVGLTWDFRVGPGTDSEQHHLHEILLELPPQSLLTRGAGFIRDCAKFGLVPEVIAICGEFCWAVRNQPAQPSCMGQRISREISV